MLTRRVLQQDAKEADQRLDRSRKELGHLNTHMTALEEQLRVRLSRRAREPVAESMQSRRRVDRHVKVR